MFAHGVEDLNSFRYIVSNFIDQGLCKKVEVQRAFHVSDDTIHRYYKLFKEKGADGFFGERPRSKRRSHKVVGETTLQIQKEIDKGRSINGTAKEIVISEGTIRYQIQQVTERTRELEKRMLIKQIIQTPANILPNHQNNTLTVTIYSMSNQRYNQAVHKILDILNESKSVFPGTDLIMVFKSTAS